MALQIGDYSSLLKTPPPPTDYLKLTFPLPRVMLVTLNRPKHLNSINAAGAAEMAPVFHWLDSEPSLIIAVVTGAGDKAFCAGADLKEWSEGMNNPGGKDSDVSKSSSLSGKGEELKGLSRRRGKKPVIAAVNGLALGGGSEFAMNCDMIVASENAVFGFPEVTIGVIPFAGVLPRLIRTLGLHRASEMALTGRRIKADEAERWGFVNKIVPQGTGSSGLSKVVEAALGVAKGIADFSPDAIIATRSGLREGWVVADVEEAVDITTNGLWAQLLKGENVKEGLKSFGEKRKPIWKESKL